MDQQYWEQDIIIIYVINLWMIFFQVVMQKSMPLIGAISISAGYGGKKSPKSSKKDRKKAKTIKTIRLDLWVIRISADGKLKNSYPCNNCLHKMKECGIRRVYYSNDQGEIICQKLTDMKFLHKSAGMLYHEEILK